MSGVRSPRQDRSTSPSKHEANSAATRARLIALGVERFPLKGYSATSVRDILRDSGLAIGAFYYHFPTKDDYFLAILESLTGEPGRLRLVAEAAPSDDLREAIRLVLEPLASDPAGGAMSLVVADFALAHKGDAEVRARVAAMRERTVREVADFVEVMQRRGLVRTDRDASMLASMAFATIEGHVVHQEIYGAGFDTALEAAVRVLEP